MHKKHQLSSWPFEVDHLERWAYWENLFTKEECATIITLGKLQLPQNATLLGAPQGEEEVRSVRDSRVSWLCPSAEHNWIFERVEAAVKHLNNDFFKFDLYGMVEGFQFTEYIAPTGFYGAHTDNDKGITPRKLSVVIQLSADEDYEGGELVFHYQKDPVIAPTAQGKAIVFPSFTLHEVKPVTKGTRHSLVCWISGKPFR